MLLVLLIDVQSEPTDDVVLPPEESQDTVLPSAQQSHVASGLADDSVTRLAGAELTNSVIVGADLRVSSTRYIARSIPTRTTARQTWPR